MESNKGAVTLVFGQVEVSTGFRVAAASELAGGPLELEFSAEIVGEGSLSFLSFGDRMRHRPRDFAFDATFSGVALGDPLAHLPDFGGPGGVVEITPARPLRQRLILNQFVRLEDTVGLLDPGASGRLVVACRRTLPLSPDEQATPAPGGAAPLVEAQFGFDLHRDDVRLADLVDQLIAEVRDGPREERERPLTLLLTLRAPAAVERWRSLVNHADPLVAERVRESLSNCKLPGSDPHERSLP